MMWKITITSTIELQLSGNLQKIYKNLIIIIKYCEFPEVILSK